MIIGRTLQSLYPDYDWIQWKFVHVPIGYWNDIQNRRKFFDFLGKKLNIVAMDDWYSVKQSDITQEGGHGMLYLYYNNSVCDALKNVYPDYDWLGWLFEKAPHGFWQ
jgi:hypothetical protein